MSESLLTFFFVGILVEIAILLFMAFRRARGSCLAQLVCAFFAFFAVLFVLLALVGLAEKPIAFTDQMYTGLPGAFVILAFLIVVLKRGMPIPLAAPRKRPLFVDMIGCAALGAVGVVVFVLGLGLLIVLLK